MKKKVHPQYFKNATQRCACGAVFHIPSTKKEVEIEICSQCHPFYTGKSKIVDVTGQVEKFKKRAEKTEKMRVRAPKKTKPSHITKRAKTSKKKEKTIKKKVS